MKKATITVTFEQEKLKAVQFYISKCGVSLEAEIRPRPLAEHPAAAAQTEEGA